MDKLWEIIGTIALEKVLWTIEFIKIGYWAPKEQCMIGAPQNACQSHENLVVIF